MKQLISFFIIGSLLMISCRPKASDKSPEAGEINTDRFVVIGGAEMGGFMDDALYDEGQEASLGNLLALQFQKIGLGEFIQPLVSSTVGCNKSDKSKLFLGYKTDCLGVSSLSPIRYASTGDLSVFSQPFTNAHHNFGIPELKVTSLWTPGYASENPYFMRMSANPSTDKVAAAYLDRNPTFFAMMLGMDDVLEFAKKGASVGDMTSIQDFSSQLVPLIDSLMSKGSKGVISTVPDVTDLPFFTTIPYNGLKLTAEKAASLNQIYNPIGITFQVGDNPFMIEDPSIGGFGVRKMMPGECVLLSVPLDSVKCNQMGSVFPLRDEFVLTLDEVEQIQARINAYNDLIAQQALTNKLASVDAYNFYKKLKGGLMYNGIKMSLTFVSGGTVSLDGIHLTPRGNALLANEFIKSINSNYKSTIPLLNATAYRGNRFP